MEQALLAASLRSRADFDLVRSYIDVKQNTYSQQFRMVMGRIGEYYQRDSEANSVAPEVLLTQIAETVRNDKHVERFRNLIAEAAGSASSDVNVRAAILLAKKQEIGDKLAVMITNGGGGEKERTLHEEYLKLRDATDLEVVAEDEGFEVYHDIDLEALVQQETDPTKLIKISPPPLNDRLDGGAKKGHHLVIFGPVESGKSLCAINAACGIARQNKRVLYFINEDRPVDIIFRMISNFTGMTKYEIQANPKRARELANDRGFQNIIVIGCSPGTIGQFSDYIEEYDPDATVFDQLRNIKVKAENRTNQLESAATGVRNLIKAADVLGISVTQAGDSASGKLILETGDVDSSNVGIPAQADVMIGIGFNEQFESEGLRNFSLPKNKISGKHENFPVRFIPQLSRYTSI